VYNRFAYLEERRAALEAWGEFIARLDPAHCKRRSRAAQR
jgi:hypothetical protein